MIKRLLSLVVKGVILIMALPIASVAEKAAYLPVEFFATYDASIKGFAVSAQRRLVKKAENEYQLTFKANALLASVAEQSTFTYNSGKLAPQYYTYQQKSFGKQRVRTLTFLPQEKRINSTHDGQSSQLPYDDRILDVLNYQLQLQMDIAQGNTSGQYTVANKGATKTYYYSLLGQETLETAVGALDTIKVRISRDKPATKTTEIWLAKDWHYLLVALEQVDNDTKTLTIHLKSAVVDHQPLTADVN